MLDYIKNNRSEIIQAANLLQAMQQEGYYLGAINRDYDQGVLLQNYQRGDSFILWRDACCFCDNEIAKKLLWLVIDNENLFNCLVDVKINYDNTLSWGVEKIIRDYDFKNYQDQITEKYYIKLNRSTKRVSKSKPKQQRYSVLIALNMD